MSLLPPNAIRRGLMAAPSGYTRNGLIAEYLFAGNANDTSGNNYDGTVTGATLTTDSLGNPNSAYLFSKSTEQFIAVNGIPITSLTESTIVVGYRYDGSLSSSVLNSLFSSLYQGSDDIRYGIRASDDLRLCVFDDGVVDGVFVFGGIPIDNSYHVTVNTQKTDEYKLYNDQILIGTDTTGSFDYAGASNQTKIGNRVATTTEGLVGMIDFVLLYDRVLTQEEIDLAVKT